MTLRIVAAIAGRYLLALGLLALLSACGAADPLAVGLDRVLQTQIPPLIRAPVAILIRIPILKCLLWTSGCAL